MELQSKSEVNLAIAKYKYEVITEEVYRHLATRVPWECPISGLFGRRPLLDRLEEVLGPVLVSDFQR